MRHGDFPHQCQAKPRTIGAIGHERLKETWEHLWGYPTPGITDLQEQMGFMCVCRYTYHSAAWGVLQGIAQEILHARPRCKGSKHHCAASTSVSICTPATWACSAYAATCCSIQEP